MLSDAARRESAMRRESAAAACQESARACARRQECAMSPLRVRVCYADYYFFSKIAVAFARAAAMLLLLMEH